MLILRLGAWLTGRHGPRLASLRQRFVALDLETTGLDVRRDAIVSVAIVPFANGAPTPGYVTLVDPARPIPAESTAIHGLTEAMVRGAPRVDRVVAETEAAFADDVVVGHAVAFDIAMLDRARRRRRRPRLRNPVLDIQRLAMALHPEWRRFTLEDLAGRFGVEVVARHTAEGDALTAGRIFWKLLSELEMRGVRTVGELLWLQRRSSLG